MVAPETVYLFNILAFLVVAVVIVYLFGRMRASTVLGYLVAGMLIGPHVLRVVTDPTQIQLLGEIGVLFLLFTLGLQLPLQRLQSLKKYVFGLGTAQVVITGTIFTLIGIWAGLSNEAAVLVGGALSLSSTAVVVQVLNDRRELATRFGRVSFSILLLQDLAVVLLLILTTTLGQEEKSILAEVGFATIKATIALVIIMGLGRFVFRPFFRAVAMSGIPELFMGTTFLIVLGTAFITEISGLSMELGAFLAGMLLAETEYRHQIEADVQPFRGLLLGVFFISVGMGINLALFLEFYPLILGGLIAMLILKALLLFCIARISGLKTSTSLKVSFLLAGGGEFVFVIFSTTVSQKFLSAEFDDLLFLIVIFSLALTPFLASFGKWCADKFQVYETHSDPHIATEELGELKNHVIIAGFGRVGQMLGELLTSRLIPFVAIDTDMRRVTEGRDKGLPVFYGDVRRLEVLKAIGAERAKVIVITLNQMSASVRTVTLLRRHFPDLPVCVRIKDHKHHEKLITSGARLVVPETVEPTIQLATSTLHVMGLAEEEVVQIIDTFRRQQWMTGTESPKKKDT